MSKAAEYHQRAENYRSLTAQTKNPDLRRQYEALSREYRDLAEAEDKLAAKRAPASDKEAQQLAERILDRGAKNLTAKGSG
jgi:hypothetical protein